MGSEGREDCKLTAANCRRNLLGSSDKMQKVRLFGVRPTKPARTQPRHKTLQNAGDEGVVEGPLNA